MEFQGEITEELLQQLGLDLHLCGFEISPLGADISPEGNYAVFAVKGGMKSVLEVHEEPDVVLYEWFADSPDGDEKVPYNVDENRIFWCILATIAPEVNVVSVQHTVLGAVDTIFPGFCFEVDKDVAGSGAYNILIMIEARNPLFEYLFVDYEQGVTEAFGETLRITYEEFLDESTSHQNLN